MKITITDECIACEQCVEICPEVFVLEGDIAEVIVDEVPEEYQQACREAAEECPAEAIIIEE
ncbi:MAG: ferredoxin [Thermodesulfobacteriota bacterium]|nr:ferredoxin [Thermodesulfobacteriota bacterium]